MTMASSCRAGGPWAGKDAVGSNEDIIAWLDEDNALIAREDITHSYPHCWRCKNPVIFRATTQWFVSMDKTGLREKALEQIDDNVRWIPAWASNRIGSMVEERPDCASAASDTGAVPIPVFKCKSCGEIVANEESFDAVIELFRTKGCRCLVHHCPRGLSALKRVLSQLRQPESRARKRRPRCLVGVRACRIRAFARLVRICIVPRMCISRAPTNIAAGSSPRCSRAWEPMTRHLSRRS